ncbi:GATA zinc finger domain-containing protein 14 [Teleopsis dalmanni]|uniref:GATA zinc finger domain-containing protein 14 n=1 Tax=Teleopsis dalmanni TaxID=139649 RepID=UPI0018CD130A|nr:GATA zinc finger domain-containing protein 14 [Teleopsis dalmanni]
MKTRQKYEQFLEEQRKRNERNKMLVQMLERIDQQAATMSARSERLKMLKLQYEMYFAKLMQSQTIRQMQQTSATPTITASPAVAALTPIPILVPTAPTPTATSIINDDFGKSTMQPATATNRNENTNLLSVTAATPATLPATFCLTPRQQHEALPSNCAEILTPHHWTLAMATPTPAGMLLTTPSAAATVPQDFLATYNYMPRSQRCLQTMQMNTNATNFNGDDLQDAFCNNSEAQLPTLRNFNHANYTVADINLARTGMSANLCTTPSNSIDNFTAAPSTASDKYLEPKTMHMSTPLPLQQLQDQHQQQILSETSSIPLTPLTVDKLPKPLMAMTEKNFTRTNVATPAAAATAAVTALAIGDVDGNHIDDNGCVATDDDNVVTYDTVSGEQPQTTAQFHDSAYSSSNSNNYNKNNNGELNSSNRSVSDKGAWGPPRIPSVQNVTKEKLLSSTDNIAVNNNANNPVTSTVVTTPGDAATTVVDDASNIRQKIDLTWQSPSEQQMTQSWHTPERDKQKFTDNGNNNNNTGYLSQNSHISAKTYNENLSNGFSDISRTNYATTNYTNENQISPSTNEQSGNQSSKSQMNIENIENAIYGELLNPPFTAESQHLRTPAQGLIEDLVAKAQTATAQQEISGDNNALHANEEQSADIATYASVEYGAEINEGNTQSSVSYNQDNTDNSNDPTYATIGDATNAEVYPQVVENSYSENIDSAADYAQYAADASPMAANEMQQDYANMSYANYDASQYNQAYDPNAYPGYTYDETTGEYTPDATQQQYAEMQDAYAAQGYEPQATYDDMNQQSANYDYSAAYAEQTGQSDIMPPSEPAITAESIAIDQPPAPLDTTTDYAAASAPDSAGIDAVDEANDQNVTGIADSLSASGVPATSKVIKPTSILSSSVDKHAMSNDAQKRKKRVNFVDSSETDDSSSVKAAGSANASGAAAPVTAASSESDFDFSASGDDAAK